MDLHRRHLLGLLGPGLATLAAVADEEAAPASKQRTDDFRDEDLAGAILTIDLAAVQGNWRILDSIAGGAPRTDDRMAGHQRLQGIRTFGLRNCG